MKYNYKLNPKQKQEIIKKYRSNMKICDIANEYHVDPSTISKLLSRRNIMKYLRSDINRRYQINEIFFDDIDSEIKAYFLGFLYADGCNVSDSNAIKLSLKESDKEILEKLKLFVTTVLQNDLNIKSSIYKQKNIWELRTNGNKQTQKVMDWLYCDSNYYLARKYDKYLQFKSSYGGNNAENKS